MRDSRVDPNFTIIVVVHIPDISIFVCARRRAYVTAVNNSPYTSRRANTSPSPEVWGLCSALCIHSSACRSSFFRD